MVMRIPTRRACGLLGSSAGHAIQIDRPEVLMVALDRSPNSEPPLAAPPSSRPLPAPLNLPTRTPPEPTAKSRDAAPPPITPQHRLTVNEKIRTPAKTLALAAAMRQLLVLEVDAGRRAKKSRGSTRARRVRGSEPGEWRQPDIWK